MLSELKQGKNSLPQAQRSQRKRDEQSALLKVGILHVGKDFQTTKMALGEYQMCQSHFSPRQFCGIFKPPQIFEVYPLTLIPCRKGNWSHVGSMPTTSTHSRVATLIVGRVTEPMMEVVSLPPKEVTNKVSKFPIGCSGVG